MLLKSLSLIFAGGALVGAVVYAQNKAEKGKKATPVFESSKSGTPTPWPDDKESPTAIRKKPVKKGEEEKVAKPKPQEPEKKSAADTKDNGVKIMPSSKSMAPEPPVKKPPPPPT